ncbi:hypothetical protein [Actinoplanes sp. RD1]|uniref:hypothetical protein n=1 Tax=Actinoplanes sp. RD1 TaxID=3064538 RepID=UPI0027403CAE|nr:hypothetical protein [Actinoplanes sp. RD1]
MSNIPGLRTASVTGDLAGALAGREALPLRNIHHSGTHAAPLQRGAAGALFPARSLLHTTGIAIGPERAPASDSSARDRTGLPLAQLLDLNANDDRYFAVTTLDDRGRLADRAPLRALNWDIGTALTLTADAEAGVISVNRGGDITIARPGRLHLPAAVRHACRLRAGVRMLVVAEPSADRLIAYLPFAVEVMMSAYRATQDTDRP